VLPLFVCGARALFIMCVPNEGGDEFFFKKKSACGKSKEHVLVYMLGGPLYCPTVFPFFFSVCFWPYLF
jgi:hypothetical protein